MLYIAVGDKNSLGRGEQTFPEYFFTCSPKYDQLKLVKFQVINCSTF